MKDLVIFLLFLVMSEFEKGERDRKVPDRASVFTNTEHQELMIHTLLYLVQLSHFGTHTYNHFHVSNRLKKLPYADTNKDRPLSVLVFECYVAKDSPNFISPKPF